MDDRRKREALAAARNEIARRLARICSSLPPEEFDKLLDRMARVHWKYDVLPLVPGALDADLLATGEHTAEHTAEHPVRRRESS
jgi:hypothetical protein